MKIRTLAQISALTILGSISFAQINPKKGTHKTPTDASENASGSQAARITDPYEYAAKYWESMLTRCGTDYYGYDTHYYAGPLLTQYHELKWFLRKKQLSEADTLNGIEFEGYSELTWSRKRQYDKQRGWQDWDMNQGGVGPMTVRYFFTRKKGIWSVPYAPEITWKPIKCSEIPN